MRRKRLLDSFLDNYQDDISNSLDELQSFHLQTEQDRFGLTDIYQGNITYNVQINIYINGKKRIPDAEELYQEILRKRNGGDYR